MQGTAQAEKITGSREEWTTRWIADAEINPAFLGLLAQNGGDTTKPTKNVAAWEACVEPLKEKFSLVKLGFTKSDLYRAVLPDLIAKPDDFLFAWRSRKADLLKLWRTDSDLKNFWESDLLVDLDKEKLKKLRTQKEFSDDDFCELCQELQKWLPGENARRRKAGKEMIPRKTLGLRGRPRYGSLRSPPHSLPRKGNKHLKLW